QGGSTGPGSVPRSRRAARAAPDPDRPRAPRARPRAVGGHAAARVRRGASTARGAVAAGTAGRGRPPRGRLPGRRRRSRRARPPAGGARVPARECGCAYGKREDRPRCGGAQRNCLDFRDRFGRRDPPGASRSDLRALLPWRGRRRGIRARARDRVAGRPGDERAAVGRGRRRWDAVRHGAAVGSARVAMSRILVVEDEPAIADAVGYALREAGYEVDCAADGDTALSAARSRPYDLMVLDLLLPGTPGIEVCRTLREEGDLPIVVLTARDTEAERITGLDTGADDYITKPFSIVELVSRVRALLRRRELDRAHRSGAVRLGALSIDVGRHSAAIDDRPLRLTVSEFRLVQLLASEPGRTFT